MSLVIFLIVLALVFFVIGVLSFASRAIDRRLALGGAPDLYPGLDLSGLAQAFDAETARQLANSAGVLVVPLAGDDPASARAGRAIAALLRRDLGLVPGLSPRGFEDSPHDPIRQPSDVQAAQSRAKWVLGGTAQLEAGTLTLRLWGVRAERQFSVQVQGHEPRAVLLDALDALTTQLGVALDANVRRVLPIGHPESFAVLERLGAVFELARMRDQRHDSRIDLEVEAHALDLLVDSPALSVLGDLLGPHRLADLHRLYQRDPHHAGLCFHIACVASQDGRYPREVFQFLRRALELCPAHGKANMLFAHAAPEPARMGHHSELAHRLLPENSFAASNYAQWLATHERAHERIIPVARAAIDLAPADPDSYEQLIDAYEMLGDFERAAEVARELLDWFEPLHPRTRYCLEQTPGIRARLMSGAYDPAAQLKERIARLDARGRKAVHAQAAS